MNLPLGREKALAAIAAGWGRTATAAHPLCRCGKPYRPACWLCQAKVGQPCQHHPGDPLVLSVAGRAAAHSRASERRAGPTDCPMHRPEAATGRSVP